MGHYLGIDLGGTNIVAGIVDENLSIIHKYTTPTLARRSFEEIAADMAQAGKKALKGCGLDEGAVDYVGIGAPGAIHPKSKNIIYANNLGWEDRDLAGEFQKHWHIPIEIANDADCAALGEFVARQEDEYGDVLMLTLGTGVGGGIILNKKIYTGGDGFGCEPGHIVLEFEGFPCTCGNKGCFEAYASVTALIRQTIDAMLACPFSLMWKNCNGDLNRVNGRTAFDAARQGDEAAKEVVDQYIRYVAGGIASLVSLMRPQLVIIGGGAGNEGEYILKPIRHIVKNSIIAKEILDIPQIVQAKLGNDAGIIGAAMLGKA